MSCRKTRSELAAFVDGALEGRARARVEAHLAGCPGCAAEAARLRRLNGLLGAAAGTPAVDVDSAWLALSERLEAEQASSPAHSAWWRAWWIPAPALAAAAGVVAWLALGPQVIEELPVGADEAAIVEHLEMLEHLDCLEAFATLEEAGLLEDPGEIERALEEVRG